MSSHDATHHNPHNEVAKSKTAFSASFWLVIILVGLFIAALNFISVMSHDDGGHGGAVHETHAPAAGHEAAGGHHDATESHEVAPATHEAVGTDTAAHHTEEAHH